MPRLQIKKKKGAVENIDIIDAVELDMRIRQMGRKDKVSFDGGKTFVAKKKVTAEQKEKFLERAVRSVPKKGQSETVMAKKLSKKASLSIDQTKEFQEIQQGLEANLRDGLLNSMESFGQGLSEALKATSAQLDTLQEEITTQANLTGEAQGEYQAVMEKLRRLNEEFSSRLSEGAIQNEIESRVDDSVQQWRSEFSEKITGLTERYEALEKKQHRLEVEQDFVDELIDENQQTYRRYKPGFFEVLEQKIEKLEEEQENLEEKLTKKNERLDEQARTIARLRANDDLVEREEIQTKLEELARREQALGSKEALATERDELKARLAELEAQRETYEAVQEQRDQYRSEKHRLRQLEKDKAQLTKQLAELRHEKDRAKATSSRYKEDNGRLQELLKDRDEKIAELEGELAKLTVARDSLQSREDKILEVREGNKRRQAELDARKVEIETERAQKLEEMRAENRDTLRAMEEQLQAKYDDKHAVMEDELTREIEKGFADKIHQLKSERDRLKPYEKSYEKLTQDYQEVTADLREWELKREQRERTRAAEEAEIEKAQQKRAELGEELAALREEQQELVDDIGSLSGMKNEVQAELESLTQRRDQRKQEVADDEESRKAPIHAGYFKMAEHDLKADVEDEAKWLEGVTESIEEAGFVFPERLIKAFHTSLKIAEWAPLTVLAGVSGTGKSELPRLYSRYGGLHHQLISVKPNWDSPQDLFGFFNYMDNRYKATDLLKALVQSQKGREDDGFDDQMLLVLLDEMNLARVELYFSDFLSKLEARRGKDKAPTIGVDIGSGFDEEEVSLGRNVLFVGTMNEDETTKTLSDKVLDRGNVISFPRPKNLQSRDEIKFPEADSARLPHKTWKSWIVTPEQGLDSEVRGDIRDAMNRVNRSLRTVNRAIGHRVLQAIENYVANHPDVRASSAGNTDDLWKAALEDQVVQKIMPKLRGIETDTEAGRGCLGGIREVLDEYAPSLVDDFEQARSNSYGAFRWSSADYLEEGQ